MKGLTRQRKIFVKGIVAREKLPDWDRLWDDFTQEELQDKDIHPKKKSFDDDMALVINEG